MGKRRNTTVTLKDIAEKAGVSKATVSNVINGNRQKVSEQKAHAIQRLIDTLGYVPNHSARSLSNRSSKIISLIVHTDRDRNVLEDPYTAAFAGALLQLLQQRDYFGMIRCTSGYNDILKNLRSWNVDGVIFFGTFDKDIRDMQERADIPFVFTDSYSSVRRINNVGIDDFKGGMLAAEHLAGHGHRQIAFFAPNPVSSEVDAQRKEGFAYALSKHGVALPERNCFMASASQGDAMAESLLSLPEKVTGVFVTADICAIALIEALERRGVKVPKDVSVIGFDDIPASRLITPKLTTVQQDIPLKARYAVDILMRHLKEPAAPTENVILDVTLIPRGSVASINHNPDAAGETGPFDTNPSLSR